MSTTKNVNLPDIGDLDSVDVIEILVKIGDLVKENDSIITLETDKATMEIPAPFSGRVTNLAIKVGDKVTHGDLILTVESDSEPAEIESEPSVKSKEPEVSLEDSTPAKDKPNKLDQKKEEISLDTEPDSHASPSIRKLARELGVSLSKISGSGQKGRILAEDLKSYVKQIVTTGNIDDEVEIIPLSRIKKISGKHLTHCWTTIPHVTQFDEVNIEQMEQFRQHQKERNIKLSPLVFIMKAVVQVLKNHPNFNASLDKNGENLVIKKYFNLGIAVDTPNGLVVPVVRDVGKKSLIELAKELKETSERAREGLLKPEEMRDAGFTISSLGGIGGTQFTPIINSPEVAILGVSRTQIKPIWNGESFEPAAMLPLALSYDHRVIDGAEGARFMADLNQVLRNITEMLL
ncbi:MAG: 2-oxo acid dehydrogenase subunit E2 [Candidatus Thioglobus autotrophicus]|nr:2-oxo acid dehydrogenase subunit E2 [Candidatus Thioglobus autotrophicus]